MRLRERTDEESERGVTCKHRNVKRKGGRRVRTAGTYTAGEIGLERDREKSLEGFAFAATCSAPLPILPLTAISVLRSVSQRRSVFSVSPAFSFYIRGLAPSIYTLVQSSASSLSLFRAARDFLFYFELNIHITLLKIANYCNCICVNFFFII